MLMLCSVIDFLQINDASMDTLKVTIDPDYGGATLVTGGIPTLILAAGYIGSTFFGGVLVLAGFDTLVAKIMSFIVGMGLVLPLVLVRDKL